MAVKKLPARNIGAAMTTNWGRPTAYTQRTEQARDQIIEDNDAAVDQASQDAQDAADAAAAAADTAQAGVDYLGDLFTWLLYLINVVAGYQSVQIDARIRGYINSGIRGTFRGHGQVTGTTSGGGTPGYINISHGKGAYPDAGTVHVQMVGTYPYCVNIASYDSSVIAVYVWDPATGVGASGVSVTLEWGAWFWDGYAVFGPPGVIVVTDPPTPP